MGISNAFTDKAAIENLVDTEAAELQRYVPEKVAQQYRKTKLKALTSLATPRSASRAFVATTAVAAVGGACVAGAAELLLGMGTTEGAVLFELGATAANFSPIFGVVASVLVSIDNESREQELHKEITRSHRRTEQMRNGVGPGLSLNT